MPYMMNLRFFCGPHLHQSCPSLLWGNNLDCPLCYVICYASPVDGRIAVDINMEHILAVVVVVVFMNGNGEPEELCLHSPSGDEDWECLVVK